MDSTGLSGETSDARFYDARAVVASLYRESPHYFSSLSAAADREHVVLAGKDSIHFIRCDPSGLNQLKTINVSQYLVASSSTEHSRKQYGNRDMQSHQSTVNVSVSITDVAWSYPQHELETVIHTMEDSDGTLVTDSTKNSIYSSESKKWDDSLIAVAGSNGVVVIWKTESLLNAESSKGGTMGGNNSVNVPFGRSMATSINSRIDSTMFAQPEAILAEHTRAVNRLVWHHKRAGLLLTASQDSSVKLMERKPIPSSVSSNLQNMKQSSGGMPGWLENLASIVPSNKKVNTDTCFTWTCVSTFTPRAEAIRDLQWSPFDDNVFAMVTDSGFLLVYDISSNRPTVRIAAHAREATSLDWHPWRRHVLATGGGDRTVKVWDLDGAIVAKHDESSDNGRISNEPAIEISKYDEFSRQESISSHSSHGLSNTMKRTQSMFRVSKPEKVTRNTHVLSVAAPVTKIKWRPPSGSTCLQPDASIYNNCGDHHDAMIAVATAPIHGTNSTGSGCIGLWSYHRPFMALSIVEGHHEGSVTDFMWVDSPLMDRSDDKVSSSSNSFTYGGMWQHVLSIGKDGQCLLQSLVRGIRPLNQVPKSTFALACLSPFQPGYGSLQIIAAHQPFIPAGFNNDFALCGLREDDVSSSALGVFKDCRPIDAAANTFIWIPAHISGQREPAETVELTFTALDCGSLDEIQNLPRDSNFKHGVKISPELIHLSRFAESYQLRCDSNFPSRISLCRRNATVAKKLDFDATSRMWTVLASLYELICSDETKPDPSLQTNPMHLLFLSTVKNLLLERADAGDIQTCVAICEVIGILPPTNISKEAPSQTTTVPGIDVTMVREWYLSYIDLLQQMCLFSHATDLMKNCFDPEIRKMNQQSTIVYESCPSCNKPLQGLNATSNFDRQGNKRTSITCQRTCTSCRQKFGFCFVCQERVESLFVWCPGCGHGGHLNCALEWYSGGCGSKALEEFCPSGCGHRCNFFQQSISFPRTESLLGELQSYAG